LHRDLTRIKDGTEELIKLPAFDHSRADPEPDTHAFDRNRHKVVLCEGLWLLHDKDGWEDIAGLFDFTIYIECDIDVCIERVKIRNLCIPGYTPEEIQVRCEMVDRVNAELVAKSKSRADLIVGTVSVPG
jgi:pantothenate kinase